MFWGGILVGAWAWRMSIMAMSRAPPLVVTTHVAQDYDGKISCFVVDKPKLDPGYTAAVEAWPSIASPEPP